MALAWLDVNYEHPESIPEWSQARQEVAALFGLSESAESVSFETILESDLMADTLWKEPEFVLWRAMLMGSPGQNEIVLPVENTKIPRIIVDRNKSPNLPFQKYVRKQFERKKKSGLEYVKISAEPHFIRVDYSTKSGLAPLPFSTIKDFKIPIYQLDGIEMEDVECWYTLFAVVSLQQDSIRNYSFEGEQILHYPSSPGVSTAHNSAWSIEDDIQGRFVLFYVWAGHEGDKRPRFGVGEFARIPRYRSLYKVAEDAFAGVRKRKNDSRAGNGSKSM